MSRQHFLELPRLPFAELFGRQPWQFAVRDAVQAVRANLGRHVPVLRVDDEIRVFPLVRREVIICLVKNGQHGHPVVVLCVCLTLVATICSSQVLPGKFLSPNSDRRT